MAASRTETFALLQHIENLHLLIELQYGLLSLRLFARSLRGTGCFLGAIFSMIYTSKTALRLSSGKELKHQRPLQLMTNEEKIDKIVMLREGRSHGEIAASYCVIESAVGCIEIEYEAVLGTHAERAIDLMLRLLPEDHLLLSSSKRVKALILEEMAIDNPNKDVEKKYLAEAHSLHKEALAMAMRAFGEMNVQTAKHYGNLGRLYQSMRHFQEAEEMHLKAIMIKEQLLGPEDYEVALSVGHLASLYNYDMMKYDKAESLYLRSIAIGK
ncbi:amyloid protein-binding protein 2-like [Macrobrachium nipponense]|uniref:amyloid protein-binding protein 2-like n=1 Tax=Macrobrachium nipponense TaxID=159736 RepID=UPI0030C8BE7A